MTPRETGFFASDNASLYYEVYGGGPPLVLLHGNGETLHSFDEMLPLLADRSGRTLLAMDTRGHGQSERGSGPLSYQNFARDVVALLDHRGLAVADVIGFSDGGIAALEMGMRFPDRCGKLVAIGANMTPKGLKSSVRLAIGLGAFACGILAPFSARARRQRELLTLMLRQPQLTQAQLSAITAPCLILAGEHDIILEAETRAIAEAIPHAELCVIPGAGHEITGKTLPEMGARILQFLGDPVANSAPGSAKTD